MTTLAVKTLAAIEAAMQVDQGATYRLYLKEVMPTAEDAFRGDEPPFRTHLGASLIGKECARAIWYGFHWYVEPDHSGRMLRLFNRGHLEEPRMIASLLNIGCRVWWQDDKGKQFRVAKGYKGHEGGGLDAVIRDCPDVPDEPILGEFKTHGEKSFIRLQEQGLVQAKWEHYVQMQIYMGDKGLTKGLYLATNKNTDELYGEIVLYDATVHKRFKQRAILIIDAKTPPPKIDYGKGEAFFKCKFCDYKGVCHTGDEPSVNCRTCEYAEVQDNSKWHCMLHDEFRTSDEQRAACPQYSKIQDSI